MVYVAFVLIHDELLFKGQTLIEFRDHSNQRTQRNHAVRGVNLSENSAQLISRPQGSLHESGIVTLAFGLMSIREGLKTPEKVFDT